MYQVKTGGSAQKRQQTAPIRCADILASSLHGLGFDRVSRHLALLRAWDRVIADRIKERAGVEDFRDGRLYLCVEDPIWLHELHMLRHKLKTILNEAVGEPAISDIILRIGRTRPYPPVRRTSRGGRMIRAVPPAVEENMATLLRPLRDLPCCEAMQRLFQRWASRSP
jgi:hypothetical protein